MRGYTCTCKGSQWWGDIWPCAKCEKCGSGPGGQAPQPHNDRVTQVDTDAGKMPLTLCLWCGKRKSDDRT